MNLYPYTDYHELNDDWIIGHIKKNEKDIAAIQNTIVNLNFEFDRKADKATTYTKTEVDNLLVLKANIADLAMVATTGSYNDLLNKPTIPAAQVNSDWSANTGVAQILNKPTTLSGYGITDAYTENEVDTIASGLQGQIDGIKTAANGNFTAASNITIGSRNFWRKQNGFVYLTVVLTVTANLAGGDSLLTDNDLTFVANSYLYARNEDGTIRILTCRNHEIYTEFAIPSGTVLRIGTTIFVQ